MAQRINDALVFLRVEVPQEEFTELDADDNIGEKKLQDQQLRNGIFPMSRISSICAPTYQCVQRSAIGQGHRMMIVLS